MSDSEEKTPKRDAKPEPDNGDFKPQVKLTSGILLTLIVLSLGASLVLLLRGGSRQTDVAGYVLLAVSVGLVVCGFFGGFATFQTKKGKFGGAAAVVMALIVSLLPFARKTGTVTPPPDSTNTINKLTAVVTNPTNGMENLCKAPAGSCTLFLFDYLHEQVTGDTFQIFQVCQSDRLDKGIRNYLSSVQLLDGVDLRVQRCSEVPIKGQPEASSAASALKAPAVVWGFIEKRPDSNFNLVTFAILADGSGLNLRMDEKIGDDVTRLPELAANNIAGIPLALATLVVGDLYLRQNKTALARRAFLQAKELAAGVAATDKQSFLNAINKRMQTVEAANPAAGLSSIGSSP